MDNIDMDFIISIRNLKKEYLNFELSVSELKLRPGVVTGLIGPNGAGKTTFIKCLLNLIRYDADEMMILGNNNLANSKDTRAQLGFMFDDRSFFEDLSVNNLERLVSGFYSTWENDVFQEYLTLFSIGRNNQVKQLSKGMRASLFSAIALSHNAKIAILDEPTAGLDPGSKQKMLDIFEEYVRNKDRAIFFSTHSTTDLDKIASDVVQIEHGSIKFSGAKVELLNSFVVVADKGQIADNLREQKVPFVVVRGANSNRLVLRKLDFDPLTIRQSGNFELLETNIEDIMLHSAGDDRHA